MKKSSQRKLGIALIIIPIVMIFFVLIAFALVNTLMSGFSMEAEMTLRIINFILYFIGILSVLGIFIGIPIGIVQLVRSKRKKTTTNRNKFKHKHFVGFWKRVGIKNIDNILNLFLIPIIFNIVFYFRDGQTIGDKIMKTKLVDESTGLKPSTGQLFGRFFAKGLSGIAFGLGFMWAGWSNEKQAWHDTLSGTRYIETKQYGGWITVLVIIFSFIVNFSIQSVINIVSEMGVSSTPYSEEVGSESFVN